MICNQVMVLSLEGKAFHVQLKHERVWMSRCPLLSIEEFQTEKIREGLVFSSFPKIIEELISPSSRHLFLKGPLSALFLRVL
jgi:hypothetical protein